MKQETKTILKDGLMAQGSHSKKREYLRTSDLKEGGGQFENLIFT